MEVRPEALFADAIMQEERLWVSDPKAINHIFQGANRLYERPHFIKEQIAVLTKGGLNSVDGKLPAMSHIIYLPVLTPILGDVHKRQRRAMAPAFGLVEARALYPCFARCSNSVGYLPIHTLSFTLKLHFPMSDSSRINGMRRSQPQDRVKR